MGENIITVHVRTSIREGGARSIAYDALILQQRSRTHGTNKRKIRRRKGCLSNPLQHFLVDEPSVGTCTESKDFEYEPSSSESYTFPEV